MKDSYKEDTPMRIEKLTDRHFTCVISKGEAESLGLCSGDTLDQVRTLRFLGENPMIREQIQIWNMSANIGCTEFKDGIALIAIIFVNHDPDALRKDVVELLVAQAQSGGRATPGFFDLHFMTDAVILEAVKKEQEEMPPNTLEFGDDIEEDIGPWLDTDGNPVAVQDRPDGQANTDNLRKLLHEVQKPYSYHSGLAPSGDYTSIVSWVAANTTPNCAWVLDQAEQNGAIADVYLKDRVCYAVIHGEMDRVQMNAMNGIILESGLKTEPYTMRSHLEEHYTPLAPEAIQILTGEE
jgi:hypothetical protein